MSRNRFVALFAIAMAALLLTACGGGGSDGGSGSTCIWDESAWSECDWDA